jgi:endo-1,4-beta-xylanase
VDVTELDALSPVVADGGAAQRAAYGDVATACREATNCTGVTVWGVADPYSWRGGAQQATLFDASFAAKTWYADVRCRLRDPKPAKGPWLPAACAPTAPAPGARPKPVGPGDGSTQKPLRR